ncbi:hypothetical protein BED46_008370 [Burkholderia contaminans]|uniref:Uncharacterized protein n=1 Tax=Burkholderia contaminans LMG 23361 TaxID=1334628 RepID=A0ABD4ALP7_9BURK|nr:hypothetical protein WR31_35150 [Burkholderia contaminans LMG 23361]MBA9836467.1 hypothetical protein [Burkholderia contaminans]OMI82877.1 hypothetical protein BED46_008370 [Burkholderia contaminans]RDT02853.1 hypothetical protein DWU95_15000 [Burkholderia contaminans]
MAAWPTARSCGLLVEFADAGPSPPQSDERFACSPRTTRGVAPGRRAARKSFGELTAGCNRRADHA